MIESGKCLLEYWRKLSAPDGKVPSRADFRPEDIPALLPVMMIFDINHEDICLIRLFGTGMVALTGSDITGMNYYDLLPKERVSEVRQLLQAIASQPCGYRAVTRSINSKGNSRTGESICVPVRVDRMKYPHLVWVHEEITHTSYHDELIEEPIRVQTLEEKEFIDIGFGVPAMPAAQSVSKGRLFGLDGLFKKAKGIAGPH